MFDAIGTILLVGGAIGLTIYWRLCGPTARTRAMAQAAVEARGFTFKNASLRFPFRLGSGSRAVLIVLVENSFGNPQRLYYEVDIWADLLGVARLKELPGKPSATSRLS